jgi:hypothetical protein
MACAPGQQIACACPGGAQGVQVCDQTGLFYGACSCGTTSATSAAATSATNGATTATTATSGTTTTTVGTTTVASSTSTGTVIPCAMNADLNQVTLYSNPPDLASWPVTTQLTEVDFTTNGVHVAFSKEDGAGRWPDVTPPGWTGPLEYTLGMVECINGQWYGAAVIEYWNGLYAMGGNVGANNQIAMNWYYDQIRWGKLASRQPAQGEMVGVFVAAGNLRNITSDDPAQSPTMERSNVVYMPFPGPNGSMNAF